MPTDTAHDVIEGLLRYTRHGRTCLLNQPFVPRCTCGYPEAFNAALAFLAAPVAEPAAEGVAAERWREIEQHVQPRLTDGYTAVAVSKPGFWLVKGSGPATPLAAVEPRALIAKGGA